MTIKSDLRKFSSKKRKKSNEWFFKTGPGQYGEGDCFIGVTMPHLRVIAKTNYLLDFKNIQHLLDSAIHEERMVGLLILVYRYEKASPQERKKIFDFYLKNKKSINNWDLVDVTSPNIVGQYLFEKHKSRKNLCQDLLDLAKSEKLWEKRIAIVSTFFFIKNGRFDETLKICKINLNEKHDLTHKAMGWMLREIWKRDSTIVESFLRENYKNVPRTTLRYAIERMSLKKRKAFLQGNL